MKLPELEINETSPVLTTDLETYGSSNVGSTPSVSTNERLPEALIKRSAPTVPINNGLEPLPPTTIFVPWLYVNSAGITSDSPETK